MHRWMYFTVLVFLLTSIGLLIIDLKIKEDIVNQAKALQETIDGQKQSGTAESDSIPSGLSGDLLRSDDPDYPAVASENVLAESANGSGSAKRNPPAKRRAGNASPRIPRPSE